MEKLSLDFREPPGEDIYLIALGEEADLLIHGLLREFRELGLHADRDYLGKSLKAQMKDAHQRNAQYVIIAGTDEIRSKSLTLKNMKSGEQKSIPLKEVVGAVKKFLEGGEQNQS